MGFAVGFPGSLLLDGVGAGASESEDPVFESWLAEGWSPCKAKLEGSDDLAREQLEKMRAKNVMQRRVGRILMLVCLMPAMVCGGRLGFYAWINPART